MPTLLAIAVVAGPIITALLVWVLNSRFLTRQWERESRARTSFLPPEKRLPLYQKAVQFVQALQLQAGAPPTQLWKHIREAGQWYRENSIYLDEQSGHLFQSVLSVLNALCVVPDFYLLPEGYDFLERVATTINSNARESPEKLWKKATEDQWPSREEIMKMWGRRSKLAKGEDTF